MTSDNQSSILLSSGTNEVEVVEFGINNTVMGINVVKVKEIINPISPVEMPLSHPCLEGIIQLRGDVIPVIDLAKFLGFPVSDNPKQDKYIVSEFNQDKYAFHVHTVSRIHRISWEQIEKPSEVTQSEQSCVIGVIRLDGKMILLLDFEKIMVDISPSIAPNSDIIKAFEGRDLSHKHLVIAEDSPMLRKLLQDYLPKIGYTNTTFFQNGKDALDYLLKIAEDHGHNFKDYVNILITDIEMPQMDGHYLTKTIKTHPILKDLPVVIFSSLITEDLKHKGLSVGADEQISKPEYEKLSHIIDALVL